MGVEREGNTAGVGAKKKQEGSLATNSLMSKDYHDDDDYVEMVQGEREWGMGGLRKGDGGGRAAKHLKYTNKKHCGRRPRELVLRYPGPTHFYFSTHPFPLPLPLPITASLAQRACPFTLPPAIPFLAVPCRFFPFPHTPKLCLDWQGVARWIGPGEGVQRKRDVRWILARVEDKKIFV